MNTETNNYASQALAACGFVVMDPRVAWLLRPDLWGSGAACGFSLQRGAAVAGTQAMVADLTGLGQVRVLTRSVDALAQRIQWVTGFAVTSLEAEDSAPSAPSAAVQQQAAQRRHADQQAMDKQAELKKLAAKELPAHDCHLRREILSARAQLTQQGTSWRRAA